MPYIMKGRFWPFSAGQASLNLNQIRCLPAMRAGPPHVYQAAKLFCVRHGPNNFTIRATNRTFCVGCVDGLLGGVCPNCGGGFAPRPVRPAFGKR